mmetsp:Transcript_49256/g.77899  ORF Transcript_49256/g.77899 Transcript_49256/m.77899 type:complete len:353 (-) Transcript_49256:246-1304(-)
MGLLSKVIFKPIVAVIGGVLALLCCLRCARCRLRDCECCKRFLRWCGYDEFDDFDLMVQIEKATYEPQTKKTRVRLTAGVHVVETDVHSSRTGDFHDPLNITIEQGTYELRVDLLDMSGRVIAEAKINIAEKIVRPPVLEPDMRFRMNAKRHQISKPTITLTMVKNTEDAESGFAAPQDSVDYFMKQILSKAKKDGSGASELEILKKASAGPLELFEGLGNTTNCYVAVLGPPTTRRWTLGFWHDKRDFEARRPAFKEIPLLKVQSVQADPSRHHVFVMTYFDDDRITVTLNLRRVDRARDVWVEILHCLVQKAHDEHKEKKQMKATASMRSATTGQSKSSQSMSSKSSKRS